MRKIRLTLLTVSVFLILCSVSFAGTKIPLTTDEKLITISQNYIKDNESTLSKYTIPKLLDDYPELLYLIVNTESMDDKEKQYWFDLLPSMTEDQIKSLFDILNTERIKLEKLNEKYQEEILKLNKNDQILWSDYVETQEVDHTVKNGSLNSLYVAGFSNIKTSHPIFSLWKFKGDDELISINSNSKVKYDENFLILTPSKYEEMKKTMPFITEIVPNHIVMKMFSDIIDTTFIETSSINGENKYFALGYDYIIDFWTSGIENNLNTKNYDHVALMLNFKPEMLAGNDNSKLEAIDGYRNYADSVYYYGNQEYNKSLEAYMAYIQNDVVISNYSYSDLLDGVYKYVKFKNKKVDKELLKKLEGHLQSRLINNNMAKPKDMTAEPLLFQFILKYENNNNALRDVISLLKVGYSDSKYNRQRSNYSSQWYYMLNQFFTKQVKIDSVNVANRYFEDVFIKSGVDPSLSDSKYLPAKLEFFTYCLLNDKMDTGTQLELLSEIERISLREDIPSVNYLEVEIASILKDDLKLKRAWQDNALYLKNLILSEKTVAFCLIVTFVLIIFFPTFICNKIPVLSELYVQMPLIIFVIIFGPIMKISAKTSLRRNYFSHLKSQFEFVHIKQNNANNKKRFFDSFIRVMNRDTSSLFCEDLINKLLKDVKVVQLTGEGGMGKTLSSHYVAYSISKKYIPIYINVNVEDVTTDESVQKIMYRKTMKTYPLMSKIGFEEYLFILDNFNESSRALLSILDNISCNAKYIIVNRNTVNISEYFDSEDIYLYDMTNIDIKDFAIKLNNKIKSETLQKIIDNTGGNTLALALMLTELQSGFNGIDDSELESCDKTSIIMRCIDILLDRMILKSQDTCSYPDDAKQLFIDIIRRVAEKGTPIAFGDLIDEIEILRECDSVFSERFDRFQFKSKMEVIHRLSTSGIMTKYESDKLVFIQDTFSDVLLANEE